MLTDAEIKPLQSARRDPTVDAAKGIVWLIVLNKPLYPLYVWWIAGHGLGAAFLSALSAPVFAALLLLARRDPLWLLAGLPVVGALDTAFATKLFGEASGTSLFFVPCALLVAILLPTKAYRLTWALTGLIFILAAGLHGRFGAAIYLWTDKELSALLSLNIISAASLSFFILVRFARIEKPLT
jgi:hypothetical protein